ncbi:DUF929 domain-containing protein [Sulfurisphaera javensis]|uniref:DUF929 domain-containing protein n=1 Tax=Sulfurisphaera javensis TaxID=2049879 RepID=A0AAT9GQM1_9CREN
MNKKVLGTVIAVIVIIAAFLSVYYIMKLSNTKASVNNTQSPTTSSINEIPAGKFVKISNIDLAPKGQVIVVEQSWYGCPVGAAASWAIYNVLKNYGNITYEFHYSDPDHKPANIPGLIFLNFTPTSIVRFYVAYVYNEYLNASYNGTPIPQNELIPIGEKILEEEYASMGLPPQVSQFIIQYETNVTVEQYGKPSALYVQPPHLNFAILISGPNGTYIVTTPIVNPDILSGYSPQYVFNNLDQFQQIINASNMIQQVILEAAGPLAGECPT